MEADAHGANAEPASLPLATIATAADDLGAKVELATERVHKLGADLGSPSARLDLATHKAGGAHLHHRRPQGRGEEGSCGRL